MLTHPEAATMKRNFASLGFESSGKSFWSQVTTPRLTVVPMPKLMLVRVLIIERILVTQPPKFN